MYEDFFSFSWQSIADHAGEKEKIDISDGNQERSHSQSYPFCFQGVESASAPERFFSKAKGRAAVAGCSSTEAASRTDGNPWRRRGAKRKRLRRRLGADAAERYQAWIWKGMGCVHATMIYGRIRSIRYLPVRWPGGSSIFKAPRGLLLLHLSVPATSSLALSLLSLPFLHSPSSTSILS